MKIPSNTSHIPSRQSPYSDSLEQSTRTAQQREVKNSVSNDTLSPLSPLRSHPHQGALEIAQTPFPFSKLPVKIQLQIMGVLPPEAFANLRCVNKPTEQISRDFIHRLRISDPNDIPLALKKFGTKDNLSIKLVGSAFTRNHLLALPSSLTGLDLTKCDQLKTTDFNFLMSLLWNCQDLKSLGLPSSPLVTNEILKSIRQPSKLEELYIPNCTKTQSNDLISLLLNCWHLKSLRLPSSPVVTNEVLESIRQPSKLEELYIPDGAWITSQGLISLLLRCNNLKNLRLPRMNQSANGWQVNDAVLSSIPQPSKLEEFKIEDAREVSSNGLLSRLLNLERLKVLHIKNIFQMTPAVFDQLGKRSNLRVLSLGFFNRCEAMGFKSMLRQFAQSHTLEELDISSYDPLIEEGILAQIPQISSLKSLTLSGNVYGQPGDLQFMLSQFAQSQNLEKLDLANTEVVTDELLIQISQISSLKSLVLTSIVNYTSSGLQSMLSQFTQSRNLEELTIPLNERWEENIHTQLKQISSLKSLVLVYRGKNSHRFCDYAKSMKIELKKVKITIVLMHQPKITIEI